MCQEKLCMQAYERALRRAVKRVKERSGEVHALDIGTGTFVGHPL